MDFKRLFEIVFSGTTIILMLPLLCIIIIAIKLESSGPSFYRIKRVGKNNKIFTALKFRTKTLPVPNDQEQNARITKLGGLLRKTSLDELPQFYNVLVGDMSLYFSPTLVEKDSIYSVSKTENRIQIITFLNSLKFLIPKKIRVEIIDLYDQTKVDIEEMRLDMFNDGLPLWWVDLIVLGNIISVIIGAMLDCIKRFFSLLTPFKENKGS